MIDTSEFSDHYTLNFQKTFPDKPSFVIELYLKKFKNLTITDDLTNYEAVGEGEAYDLDVTYKMQIDKVNLMLAYTYMNAKRQLNTNAKKQYRFEDVIPHMLQLISFQRKLKSV